MMLFVITIQWLGAKLLTKSKISLGFYMISCHIALRGWWGGETSRSEKHPEWKKVKLITSFISRKVVMPFILVKELLSSWYFAKKPKFSFGQLSYIFTLVNIIRWNLSDHYMTSSCFNCCQTSYNIFISRLEKQNWCTQRISIRHEYANS